LAAVENFLRESKFERVAWIDDDLDSYATEVESSLAAELRSARLLTLCPLPDPCLATHHLDALRQFFSS
jgi:hypothetical protein